MLYTKKHINFPVINLLFTMFVEGFYTSFGVFVRNDFSASVPGDKMIWFFIILFIIGSTFLTTVLCLHKPAKSIPKFIKKGKTIT